VVAESPPDAGGQFGDTTPAIGQNVARQLLARELQLPAPSRGRLHLRLGAGDLGIGQGSTLR